MHAMTDRSKTRAEEHTLHNKILNVCAFVWHTCEKSTLCHHIFSPGRMRKAPWITEKKKPLKKWKGKKSEAQEERCERYCCIEASPALTVIVQIYMCLFTCCWMWRCDAVNKRVFSLWSFADGLSVITVCEGRMNANWALTWINQHDSV